MASGIAEDFASLEESSLNTASKVAGGSGLGYIRSLNLFLPLELSVDPASQENSS